MTPDEKWQKRRKRLIRNRFWKESSIQESITILEQGNSTQQRLDMIDLLRRQLFAIDHPLSLFDVELEPASKPHKVIFCDEDEILYLMTRPSIRE